MVSSTVVDLTIQTSSSLSDIFLHAPYYLPKYSSLYVKTNQIMLSLLYSPFAMIRFRLKACNDQQIDQDSYLGNSLLKAVFEKEKGLLPLGI